MSVRGTTVTPGKDSAREKRHARAPLRRKRRQIGTSSLAFVSELKVENAKIRNQSRVIHSRPG